MAQGREVIPLCATLAALLELPRRNMLVSHYPLKLETDVLKRARDLAGEQSLCGYNTKRHKREQECIFNKHLRASFFAHTKVSEKAHLRDGLVISRTVYIRAEHFRAIGDYSVGDQINFPRVCEMAGLDCAYLRKKLEPNCAPRPICGAVPALPQVSSMDGEHLQCPNSEKQQTA